MKIAHLTATFLPYHSGTGMVCYHNAMGLAKLGHEVAVYTSKYPPEEYNDYPPEITVHRLPVRFRIGNAPLLPGVMRMPRFDIVHLHYPFIFGQEMLYLKSLFGARYVITYHQDLILSGTIGRLVKIHHALVGKLILKQAKRLMVTSLDYGENARIAPLVNHIGKRVVEMPNGVDPDQFNPGVDPQNLREKYGFAPDDVVIIFVGGLDTPHYFKGVDVLIRAFQHLTKDGAYDKARLMIVGEGDLRPKYTALAQELGLGNKAVFCGRVPGSLLPAHYVSADIGVLPSTTMGEAFGIVLLEAMASGKPVIATGLPGVRSVVGSDEVGLLATPGDMLDLAAQLKTLLDNPERRRVMGQKGRAKVEAKYAWNQVVLRLEQAYKEVLSDAGSRA